MKEIRTISHLYIETYFVLYFHDVITQKSTVNGHLGLIGHLAPKPVELRMSRDTGHALTPPPNMAATRAPEVVQIRNWSHATLVIALVSIRKLIYCIFICKKSFCIFVKSHFVV